MRRWRPSQAQLQSSSGVEPFRHWLLEGESEEYLTDAIKMHIHVFVNREDPPVTDKTLPVLPCACANLRRAARAVTRLYNQALRPDGIEITQFTLLMALNLTGETSQGALGELLALDSTTLTRMLRLLTKKRWVQIRQGTDRRQRLLSLSATGKDKLHRATSRWAQAQAVLQEALGREAFGQLGSWSAQVTAVSLAS
jgi:DNA-binding MarR family transcriptional regulator